ncbi:MAG: glutamate--tRNA ligase [Alphaproteobacteria bacterium]|nr:glutamate--tRNA ligase [Alphaproteobacteria bacterium]
MSVRVRFAPSPTGLLHIGNARAALINWLFAKKHQGVFMLRLDDTDLDRSEDRYAQAIAEDLAWLGLHHHEFAQQSKRFDRYQQAMQSLIDTGRLYPCYETPEELDYKRKRQLAKGEPPIYDRAALHLTAEQKATAVNQGIQPHWRFQLNPGPIQWHDLVRGPVEFHGDRLSDPVLVRADGAFLYTLTSVVDDLDFAITHILRGEDHVTNAAVQIQLFQALNNDQPVTITFGHTTLLMDAQGHALSKRLGSLSLGTLRESGIEPMAINSLLARLGTSLPVEPVLDLDALAADFDLGTFSRTPPHFNEDDLKVLDHKLLQLMPYDFVQDRLKNLGAIHITGDVWIVIRGNIQTLQDVLVWEGVLYGNLSLVITDSDQDFMRVALASLPIAPWSTETWLTWTNTIKAETGRKGKALYMPLRQALTGMDHGPEMKDLLPLLGYERTKERLENHV